MKDMNTMKDLRKLRGIAIISKGDVPTILNKEEFLVPSQSSDKKYKVTHIDGWQCDCPDFQSRHLICKHIHGLQFFLKVRDKTDIEDLNVETLVEDKACPYCTSENIVKNGIRTTTTEQRQHYRCQVCKKRFVLEPIKGMKANTKIIMLTLDLYLKGLSLRDISDTLFQFYNIRIHFDTIRRWIRNYTKVMYDYTDQFNAETGTRWHVDEQKVKSKGEWVWAWNCIDAKTRFLLASNLTKSRYIKDARQVLQQSKERTDTKPLEIHTDGLPAYRKAVKKEFLTHKHRLNRAVHVRDCGIGKKQNNNMIERYHNEFREFDKVRRGFKTDETTQEWLQAHALYHNFVKQHMGLNGHTPAQVAHIDLGLERNRWMSLLKLSLGNVPHTTNEVKTQKSP